MKLLKDGHRLDVPEDRRGARTLAPDERLRVLHLITNSLPHTQSGYSLRTHNILDRASGPRHRLHRPDAHGLPGDGRQAMVRGRGRGGRDPPYHRTLPAVLGATPEARLQQEVEEALRLVREFQPHVLHATTDYRNGLVAQSVSEATGIPWMFEVRGLMEQTWIASHRGEDARAAAEHSEKVRRIIATESSLARDAAADRDPLPHDCRCSSRIAACAGEQISLMPNGVDASLLAESRSPAQARKELEQCLPLRGACRRCRERPHRLRRSRHPPPGGRRRSSRTLPSRSRSRINCMS